MRRLVVAGTTILVVLGAAVVASYLLLFSAVTDRASRAAPGDTAVYVNVYLQPSAGQQMSLFNLIGRLRGFSDPATLEEKIDEVADRLLGQAGVDYLADVRPWLGAQIALAAAPGTDASGPGVVLLAAVKDAAAARTAVPRLFDSLGVKLAAQTYRGRPVMTSDSTSYALLDDLLVVASSSQRLHAALDADADVVPSLADRPGFAAAMRRLPSDHLASVYLDLPAALDLADEKTVGGYATAAVAITAEADGLHVDGAAPFTAASATLEVRRAYALAAQSPTLAGWMPEGTSAEVLAFGVAQTFGQFEARLTETPTLAPAADALNQLRTIAAIGLGVNLNRDLLPLLDGEAAVALQRFDRDGPHGQLLLRPGDPAAAHDALARVRAALAERGSQVRTTVAGGTPVTIIVVPGIATLAYAERDGVVIVGLDAADVGTALDARAGGTTLAGEDRYSTPFGLAGKHAGHETWADLPNLVDAIAEAFDPGSELRDILHQIGELAISASASGDRLQIHGVLTVP